MTMNHSFDGLEEIVDVPETFIPDEANEEQEAKNNCAHAGTVVFYICLMSGWN